MAPSHYSCPSITKITAKLLLSFLVLSPLAIVSAASHNPAPHLDRVDAHPIPGDVLAPGPVIVGGGNRDGEQEFVGSLRHIMHHGTYQYPEMLRRLDIHPETLVATEETKKLQPRPVYKALSQSRGIKRLMDRSKLTVETRLLNHRKGISTPDTVEAWGVEDVPQPDITDKETVLALAKIAADAYIEVERTEDWLEVGTPYNRTADFGWEADGLRGHIFANQDNSTVIIGLKGTSAAVFDGAETTTNDKINDNLLFSCCCARVSYWWKTVCDCFSGTAYTCNNVCLKTELSAENRYYRASLQLYYNVTQIYPEANIWVIGHSLGGAISSLLGQTYGLPVVTFEAPGEALASERLGLPTPPNGARQSSELGVYHFGHTADPIYMGACNGPTSACSIGGYAMESRCHAGMECVYDVVSDKGWRMGLGYHRIQGVIKDVIQVYDEVPKCTSEPGCVDCFNWKFVSGNGTTATTTSTTTVPTTTSSPTTTTTCLTPGWWGCRDVTTTTTTSVTGTTTTTSTTQTCSHYGWFGNCLDPTTTTESWTPSITSVPRTSATPTATPTETCRHYGWFGGCLDPESSPTPSTITSTSSSAIPTPTHAAGVERCEKRAMWGLGWCKEWTSAIAEDNAEL
ncbi:alpha/beta-hydrolase [Wilcoxina mikolae CBS 423.85]|nr:alpha/beta-hydrolase [Wilcoxina mikolae CBS 423.85]